MIAKLLKADVAASLICLFVLASSGPRARADVWFTEEQGAVTQVFRLMDERLSLMPQVAAWKWINGAAVADLEREREIIESTITQSVPVGLPAEAVRRLLELQFGVARTVQGQLYELWQQNGFDSSQPVRSLRNELRPELDRLTAEWVRALYLAASAFERPDFTSTYEPLAREYLRNATWSEETRRELLDALANLHLTRTPALERVRAVGVLRIGTTGDYAPFSFASKERLTGTDIEFAEAFANALAVKPVFVRTSWPTLMEDLQRNKFDVAMSGISITPAREAVAAFSAPYHFGGKTIIARCSEAHYYKNLAGLDRSGVRVIVNAGGSNEQFVREHVHRANIRVLPDNFGVFEEIRAGRADVMITDDVEVDFQTRQHPELCRAMEGTLTRAEKAILLPRDERWVARVNEWLEPQLRSGEPSRSLQLH